ncbi:1-acyl-sn-glycerol-3-phosphate acyltransferase [bacterium]|nr:MAG: 1-acyl-sn-glycerol-3-phosphate acyltransferase [bacterium]
MFDRIKSVYIWGAVILLFVIWYPMVGILYLFDRDPAKYRTGRFFRYVGAAMTYVNPAWKIKVSGKFPENPRNPYVIVCNHLSNADIPIISRLPWEMKWIAKAELFKIPVIGRMMTWAGDIPVDRSQKGKREKTIFIAQDNLRANASVIFFPEGTRSKTGRVIRFTDGAFILAVRNKIPILPLVIDGTSNALPKHSWVFTGESNVKLKVLEPIETAHLKKEDIPMLRDQVRDIIINQLAEWRGVDPAEVDDLIYEQNHTETTQNS